MAIFQFFKKEKIKEEPVSTVDPVIEQRRKEKFSTPLIYSEEEPTSDKKVKSETKTALKNLASKTKPADNYVMSEVISPISGRAKKPIAPVEATTVVPKKKVKKIKTEDVVSVISPFYGMTRQEKEIEEDVPVVLEKKMKEKETPVEEPGTVTENLRNLASIMKEEGDKLNIIEARTGEFQLDLKSSRDQEPSLIDEIDDSMTLDELMNLYEKKFKD